jgi:hypothetical protein
MLSSAEINEPEFQKFFLEHLKQCEGASKFFPGLSIPYEIDKKDRKKSQWMPNIIFDVIELDIKDQFHLWELKIINSSELLTGKFFGQMMLYDFLFTSSTWKDLKYRFSKTLVNANCTQSDLDQHLTMGDILKHSPEFSSWNLCVCGGLEGDLDVGINPIIWTFLSMAEQYFNYTPAKKLCIWHFYETEEGFHLEEISDQF